jgi:hypothetical protein
MGGFGARRSSITLDGIAKICMPAVAMLQERLVLTFEQRRWQLHVPNGHTHSATHSGCACCDVIVTVCRSVDAVFVVLLQKRFVSRLTGDKKVVLFAGRCAHAPNPLLSLGLLDAFLLLHPLLCSVQHCILVYGIS